MSGKEKWNLYVLRYNYSGNYYVGTAMDFEDRMLDHWRKTSDKNGLSKWSLENQSTKGFKFYWFYIEKEGVKQGEAEHCEWELARLIVNEIEENNRKKLVEKIHVGNWKLVDGEEYDYEFEPKPNPSLDEKIEEYLKEPRKLDTDDGEFQIQCCAIGYIGEYDNSQCDKSWKEVASIRFLSNYK